MSSKQAAAAAAAGCAFDRASKMTSKCNNMHIRRGEGGIKSEITGESERGEKRPLAGKERKERKKERKNDSANRAGRQRLLLHLDCQYPIPSDRRLAGQPAASVLARRCCLEVNIAIKHAGTDRARYRALQPHVPRCKYCEYIPTY